jgi:transposase InsO family protein
LLKVLKWLKLSHSKFYQWEALLHLPNHHNGNLPKRHWLLEEERQMIIKYATAHSEESYRRLTYMMLDADIVAATPSSVYRVLKSANMLNQWNNVKKSTKGNGFEQPKKPHEHWHIDIKYVNFRGTFLFLISIIDGYCRYIVHHELRVHMQESDVQITLQKALEKYPGKKPRLISDNGSQFISKDFAEYMRLTGLKHIRTSVAYPQSNGKIERFHRTLNEDVLRVKALIDLEDARKQISDYICFYNTKRLHSALNYLTPEDYLTGRFKEKLQERENKLEKARIKRYEKNAA